MQYWKWGVLRGSALMFGVVVGELMTVYNIEVRMVGAQLVRECPDLTLNLKLLC